MIIINSSLLCGLINNGVVNKPYTKPNMIRSDKGEIRLENTLLLATIRTFFSLEITAFKEIWLLNESINNDEKFPIAARVCICERRTSKSSGVLTLFN